ncbi:hypothetical protein ZHAS_00003756 [Anopheles sinensis]|uniref:Uncharacterized protein n=1 Tax=Anopheles sinensis TaxID=74873 RepID=A0A084VF22_ANOSI|nr:hypothetical protein ZHAS_00003756 [Anopheles sinensis]
MISLRRKDVPHQTSQEDSQHDYVGVKRMNVQTISADSSEDALLPLLLLLLLHLLFSRHAPDRGREFRGTLGLYESVGLLGCSVHRDRYKWPVESGVEENELANIGSSSQMAEISNSSPDVTFG